jgi:dihydrofolate reductase
MKLVLIAAVARNGVIGDGHRLLWHLPEDLQRFKQATLGAPVVMGRRTWDSLPARFRPLPGRRNVVVTRNPRWRAEGAESAASMEIVMHRLHDVPVAYVIGGAEIYAQALPFADELLMTEIDRDFEGGTCFPAWDRSLFVEVDRESLHAAPPNDFDFAFVRYVRR